MRHVLTQFSIIDFVLRCKTCGRRMFIKSVESPPGTTLISIGVRFWVRRFDACTAVSFIRSATSEKWLCFFRTQ